MTSPSAMPTTGDTLTNMTAVQLAQQVANMAAQLEFQKQRMTLLELPQFAHTSQMDIDRLAFDKANQTWTEAFQSASLTGTYQGQPTLAYLTQIAQMTGTINGQQTIQGKLTDTQIAQINATIMNTQKMTDLAYLQRGDQREQWSADHQMALQKQQADLTGFINGMPTQQRQEWEAQQGNAYVNLVSTLRGPENAFQMLKVLKATPDSLRSLADQWTGKFVSPSYGVANTAGLSPVTPQNMLSAYTPPGYAPQASQAPVQPAQYPWQPSQQIAPGQLTPGILTQPNPGAPLTGASPTTATAPAVASGALSVGQGMPGYTIDPAGSQAHPDAYNYQATPSGGVMVYPPGVTAPVDAHQASTTTPVTAVQQQQIAQHAAGAILSYTPPGSPVAQSQMPALQAAALPVDQQANPAAAFTDPTKINARAYNTSSPYEQAVGWAGYEAAGWDKSLAQDQFQKSLPKYGASAGALGTVRI